MNIATSDEQSDMLVDTLATWNRPRTTKELRSFISARHSALPDTLELE